MSDTRYMLDASAVLAMMLGEDGGDHEVGTLGGLRDTGGRDARDQEVGDECQLAGVARGGQADVVPGGNRQARQDRSDVSGSEDGDGQGALR